MNPRLAELIRLNGYKFNILFGCFSLFVVPYISLRMDFRGAGFFGGLLGLVMYVADAWAFTYKTRLIRIRVVYMLAGGNPGTRIPPLPKLGCFVNYGFMMRLVFRMTLVTFAMVAFGWLGDGEDINGGALTFLIIGVLFELYLLMTTWFESRLADDSEDAVSKRDKNELEWRKKNFPLLNDPNIYLKEAGADFVLFLTAMMFTHVFWTMSNNNFIESIDRSFKAGDSGIGVLIPILLCNLVLSLFMLVPIRLAYWVGESMSAIDTAHKWRLRLSLLFAGVSIISPVLVHFVQVYG